MFVLGPLIAFGVIAALAAILRWTFHTDLAGTERKVFASEEDFGLLRVVGTVDTEPDARVLAEMLARAGIRATLSTGADGRVRVLVFEAEADEARRLVGGFAP